MELAVEAAREWFLVVVQLLQFRTGWFTIDGYLLVWCVLVGLCGAHLFILNRLLRSGGTVISVTAKYAAIVLGTTVATMIGWAVLVTAVGPQYIFVITNEWPFSMFWVALASALFALTVVPILYLCISKATPQQSTPVDVPPSRGRA